MSTWMEKFGRFITAAACVRHIPAAFKSENNEQTNAGYREHRYAAALHQRLICPLKGNGHDNKSINITSKRPVSITQDDRTL